MRRSPWEEAARELTAAFASTDSTPGGGSAAGAVGAIGCALGQMAAGISAGKKKIDESRRAELKGCLERLGALRERLEDLCGADARAFDAVMAAMQLPKESPERAQRLEAALVGAASVPLETAHAALAALAEVKEGAPAAAGSVASDMLCAEHLLRASVLCALENVKINLDYIQDAAAVERLSKEMEAARAELGA